MHVFRTMKSITGFVAVFIFLFVESCLSTQQHNVYCTKLNDYYIVGQMLTTTCYVSECNGCIKYYQLKKDNHFIVDETCIHIFNKTILPHEIEITITNLSISDSGEYSILVTHHDDSSQESRLFNVSVFPQPAPKCSSNKDYCIIGDCSITLQCKIFSYLNLKLNDKAEYNQTISGNNTIYEREFHITDQDKGVVKDMCLFNVKSYWYPCIVEVLVKSRLNVSLKSAGNVIEGDDAVLNCSLPNNNDITQVDYIWESFPEIDMNTKGNSLTIRNVSIGLNGTEVRCTVKLGNYSEGSATTILNVDILDLDQVHPDVSTMQITTSDISREDNTMHSKSILLIRSITFCVFIIIVAILSTKYLNTRKKRDSIDNRTTSNDTTSDVELNVSVIEN